MSLPKQPKKFSVIVINSKDRTITEQEIEEPTLDALQKIVGGYIETAVQFENRDCIFVNEEGLLGQPGEFFFFKGAHQPFAGNGVLVGSTKSGVTCSCRSKLDEIVPEITFMDRADVQEWAKVIVPEED